MDFKLFSLFSSDDSSKIIGTYIRNEDTGDCLILKNLEDSDYMFKANNLNSTYFYHTLNNMVEYLHVDIKICEQKIDELNENLSIEELE